MKLVASHHSSPSPLPFSHPCHLLKGRDNRGPKITSQRSNLHGSERSSICFTLVEVREEEGLPCKARTAVLCKCWCIERLVKYQLHGGMHPRSLPTRWRDCSSSRSCRLLQPRRSKSLSQVSSSWAPVLGVRGWHGAEGLEGDHHKACVELTQSASVLCVAHFARKSRSLPL